MTPAGEGEGAGAGPPEWIPVELEILTKLWLPDTEILRLKGFHRLSVLDRLQVRRGGKMLLFSGHQNQVARILQARPGRKQEQK